MFSNFIGLLVYWFIGLLVCRCGNIITEFVIKLASVFFVFCVPLFKSRSDFWNFRQGPRPAPQAQDVAVYQLGYATTCCVFCPSPCPACRAGVDYLLPFSGIIPEVGNKTDRLTDHRYELFCVRPARPAAIIYPRPNGDGGNANFLSSK